MVRRELTDSEKGTIIGWFFSGAKISDIACETNHPRSTVDSVIDRFILRHHTSNTQRSGRPPKLSPRNERTVLHEARASAAHCQWTWGEVQATFPVQVSISTLSRSLAQNSIKKHCTATKPLLTPENAQKCKEWVQFYEDWEEDDWRRVVWSDKCSVAKSADLCQTWVFCLLEERWHCDCVDAQAPTKDISLMVWGCFAGNTKAQWSH
jgi:transposase